MDAQVKFALVNAIKQSPILKMVLALAFFTTLAYPEAKSGTFAMAVLNLMVWMESIRDYRFFKHIWKVQEIKAPSGLIHIGHADAFRRRFEETRELPEGVEMVYEDPSAGCERKGNEVHYHMQRCYSIGPFAKAYREAYLFSHDIVAVASNEETHKYLLALVFKDYEYAGRLTDCDNRWLMFTGVVLKEKP